MKTKVQQSNLTHFLTFILFFLFALTTLPVLLSGARIYQNTVHSGDARFEVRTVVQYLTTRIRQGDSRDHIRLDRFGDSDALILKEYLEGETCQTIIYCYDGWLRELFCTESDSFSPSAGEKLLPLQSLSVTQEAGCIYITAVWPDAHSIQFPIALRSGTEVAP